MSIMITYHSKNSDFCMQLAWTLWTMSFQETIIDSADSAWKPWSLDFEMLLPDENSYSKHQFKQKRIKWQTTLPHLHDSIFLMYCSWWSRIMHSHQLLTQVLIIKVLTLSIQHSIALKSENHFYHFSKQLFSWNKLV